MDVSDRATGAEIGLLPLPTKAPPERTEAIQHGIFKYGILPTAVYGLLAGVMWFNTRKDPGARPGMGETVEDETPGANNGEVRR